MSFFPGAVWVKGPFSGSCWRLLGGLVGDKKVNQLPGRGIVMIDAFPTI